MVGWRYPRSEREKERKTDRKKDRKKEREEDTGYLAGSAVLCLFDLCGGFGPQRSKGLEFPNSRKTVPPAVVSLTLDDFLAKARPALVALKLRAFFASQALS